MTNFHRLRVDAAKADARVTFAPTEDQAAALERIREWLKGHKREFVLAGLAGTGKTTMMKMLNSVVSDHRVIYLAPTNKAASVLRTKGIPASTIHKRFYVIDGEDAEGNPLFTFDSCAAGVHDLVVIDEASMIDTDMLRDLRTTEAKFLFVGDHGQLPPVGGDPGLMARATVKLETIMRQAQDNEILSFAHHIRVGCDPFEFERKTNDVVIPAAGQKLKMLPTADVWLCHKNFTRVQLNMLMVKELADSEVHPHMLRPSVMPIQIRGNYPEHRLNNGEVFTATDIVWNRRTGHPESAMLDGMRVKFHPANWHQEKRAKAYTQFKYGVLADYGYAITTHTAQGSEWDTVVVVDEVDPRDTRWRYTAATRAAKRLIWLPFSSLPITPVATSDADEVFK